MVTSNELYQLKSEKSIVKALNVKQNIELKKVKSAFREKQKLQAKQVQQLKKWIASEKKKLPIKSRRTAIISLNRDMTEMNEQIEDHKTNLNNSSDNFVIR